MSVKITWLPNTEADMAEYDVRRAPDDSGQPGVWEDLVSIAHDLLGSDYDAGTNRFFYNDDTGSLSHWYSIRAEDTDGNVSGWGNPFQPSESTTPPPFPNTVALNEDYGVENTLQTVDTDGAPVEGAQIRVYKKTDYDLANYNAIIGVTRTNATGGWENPVFVEAGFTYTVYFFKPNAFDPKTQEVVVP